MEEVKITYQSEHGEVPKPYNTATYYPTWYFADEGFYTPYPQMISRGINDDMDFFEDVYSMPAVLVQNAPSERYYIIMFDFDDVYNRRIKFWDNGDDTFKLYVYNGATLTWCAASVEMDGFPTEEPTFEEIASLMTPVKGSVISEVGSSTYLFDDNGEIATTENHNYVKNDWLIIWASGLIKDYGTPASVYDRGYTPEPSEPYYALIPPRALPPMEAEGYTFKGWSLNSEIVEGNYPINNDVTLTAVWEADTPTTVDYTITYETAHGAAPASKTVTVNEGESYTLTAADLPVLAASGYVFNGWLINGALASVGTTISANTTLTASWSVATKTITISYSTAHGTAPNSKSVTVNVGESYALTTNDLPIITADGYIFGGWTLNGVLASVGDTISDNSTLVAVWEKAEADFDWDSFVKGYRVGAALRRKRVIS